MAENLLDIICKNIAERFSLQTAALPQPGIWLQLDSYSMVQAISHLAGLLKAQTTVSELLMTITSNELNESELTLAWPTTSTRYGIDRKLENNAINQ